MRTGRPGSTVVVVFVVRVFALRPRRRVINVGLVVRVTVALLRRLVCILMVVGGGGFESVVVGEEGGW